MEKERIQCQMYIFPGVRHLVAYKTYAERSLWYAMRAIVCSKVQPYYFLRFCSFTLSLYTTCTGVVRYIVTRMPEYILFWKCCSARERHDTREIRRNYIGIRVLMHLYRVGDVHEIAVRICSEIKCTFRTIKLKIIILNLIQTSYYKNISFAYKRKYCNTEALY